MKRTLHLYSLVLLTSVAAQAAVTYKVQTRYPIPGGDSWDYITVDSAARRLYVSHSVRVNVLDADTGAAIGIIEDTPGVHGIAIAPEQKHGFTSNGKEDKVSMFDIGNLSLMNIFISNGEGNLTIIHQKSADEYTLEGSISTQQSAKTMALDTKTKKVFLPAATVVITPPADPSGKPKRTVTDGSFAVLVVGK
jgi:hypothetical protein